MSYLNAWAPEYAAASIKRAENYHKEKAEKVWSEFAVECGQVAKLALDFGDEKIQSIAQTVVKTIDDSHKLGARSRRTITPKQRYALAQSLLSKYGSHRAIAAAAWGLTDTDIDNADV
ncbi:hypothetical protein [Alcaligenes aquatilis]|uniref:Uncharacterized protein n=1 Tax=Alcaligenes aquatilis TaxID=323284 RepID=A0A3G2HWM1_9BURK|nr:hypothetical protein [Alcaligenes aquatilis]AYN21572.1 hypothetical protein D3M96_14150 [Alcaligenes aquatilis]